MHFYMLGALGMGDENRRLTAPRGATSTLLAALLLRPNRAVDAESLTELLWPTRRPASASANLRQYASRIRHLLQRCGPEEAARLRSTAGGYVLQLERDELDLTLFEDLTNAGRQALECGDLVVARARLEQSVGSWKGRICQGAVLGPKLETELLYWEELRLAAHRLLLQVRLRLGEYHQAIAETRMLLASNPLCEDLLGMLMLAFYRSYRRAEALNVFAVARRRFIQDLGMEPAPDLQSLHQSILRGDCPMGGFTWLREPAAA